MTRLGGWNDVPGRDGWSYGVILCHDDKSITVPIQHRDGRQLEFTMQPGEMGYVPIADRHEAARTAIDELEKRSRAAGDTRR